MAWWHRANLFSLCNYKEQKVSSNHTIDLLQNIQISLIWILKEHFETVEACSFSILRLCISYGSLQSVQGLSPILWLWEYVEFIGLDGRRGFSGGWPFLHGSISFKQPWLSYLGLSAMEGVNRWSMDYYNHENVHRCNVKSMHFYLEQKITQKQVVQKYSFLKNGFLLLGF